jgi:hypothetical protein
LHHRRALARRASDTVGIILVRPMTQTTGRPVGSPSSDRHALRADRTWRLDRRNVALKRDDIERHDPMVVAPAGKRRGGPEHAPSLEPPIAACRRRSRQGADGRVARDAA